MIPMVAPPLSDGDPARSDLHPHYEELDAVRPSEKRGRRDHAPVSGARNAYALVMSKDPTWRESIVGSAFLASVVAAGAGLGVVAAAMRRHRRQSM